MKQTPNLVADLRRAAASPRVEFDFFERILREVFLYVGLSAADAAAATEAASYGSLRGSETHGVSHLPLYVSGLLDGNIKTQPNDVLTSTLPVCGIMDADHALGLIAARKAMDVAIGFAKTYGLGAVAVRNSSHFGAAGYYAERAARQGFIGLAFTNAAPAIAPTGSKEALFGTNPIGLAFPLQDGRDPIVLDMATSVIARSRIHEMVARRLGPLPEGWALDSAGRPTVDPVAAVKGSVLPIGGAKGYGLSLAVELLCSALSDGRPGFDITYEHAVKKPSKISQFVLAINPDGFAGLRAYGERAAEIARRAMSSAPIETESPPRLPGERGHAASRDNRLHGVMISKSVAAALTNVADLIEAKSQCVRGSG